jgi:hypothetical protein
MAKGAGSKLGREALRLQKRIKKLVAATTIEKRVNELWDQHDELRAHRLKINRAAISQTSAEYKAAAKGVEEAIAIIDEAREGIASIKAAIDAVGKALSLLGQLV